jgi:predicted phage terminase large subunit-like protein
MRVKLVPPRGSKTARAFAVEPIWECGNVLLPRKDLVGWVQGFIDELLLFPNAKNDDQVDAMTQALIRLRPSRRQKHGNKPPIDMALASVDREGF